jgi:hypothetical protein
MHIYAIKSNRITENKLHNMVMVKFACKMSHLKVKLMIYTSLQQIIIKYCRYYKIFN